MILVIDKSYKNAANVADMFFFMGVLSKAVTIGETFSEISARYRAVIMISPESFPDPEDFIKRLRKYNSAVPIFAMGEPDNSYSHLFAQVFSSISFSKYEIKICSHISVFMILSNVFFFPVIFSE